jgi:hypothetical protein
MWQKQLTGCKREFIRRIPLEDRYVKYSNFINPLRKKRTVFYVKDQSVPRSKHPISIVITNDLMLYRTKVVFDIHRKKIRRNICGHNVHIWQHRVE